jgi:hypothetical protein
MMGVPLVECRHVNARANHFLKSKQTVMFRKTKNGKTFANTIFWHMWISLFEVTALASVPCLILDLGRIRLSQKKSRDLLP